MLLGTKGIDLPQITQKLDIISQKRTFEPLDPIADNDLGSFLKNEIENCILSSIEGSHDDVRIILRKIMQCFNIYDLFRHLLILEIKFLKIQCLIGKKKNEKF